MDFQLININNSISIKNEMREILNCNDFSKEYGLILSKEQVLDIINTKNNSLKDNGRVEFDKSVISLIIKEFCSSNYIEAVKYVETINELIELFYYYKSETFDILTDDELIEYMKDEFNGKCQGSIDLLYKKLEIIADNLHNGLPAYNNDDFKEKDDYED